ncbi:MAG: tripartite tricarboxylate transporter permease, partial [Methanomassiliicoccales archaeon]|nr:tripartite tricarboxylate transporter permease [Methanomassiliicoccales archaeon]
MDLEAFLTAALIALLGALLGSAAALVPGMHINTLSLVLLSLYPAVSQALSWMGEVLSASLPAPILFAVILVAAATAGSFVDFLPSAFLGLPDGDTSHSMLPAHRLLLQGKGLDAVRCSALGSLLGALLALLAVIPLQLLMRPSLPTADLLSAALPFVLLGAVAVLVLSEGGGRETRAVLVVRPGGVHLAALVDVRYPVPVQGAPGSLTGRAGRRGLRRSILLTPHGPFAVRHPRPLPSGHLLLEGAWAIERDLARGRLCALCLLLLSGTLGLVVMNARPPLADIFNGLGQSLLFPLLTGLFALPALLGALASGPVPAQDPASPAPVGIGPAARGALAGFLAGWLPGITSTIGATMGALLSPEPRDREQGAKDYLLMLASVGTSATVFSVLALCIEGKGRTGAMLALAQVLGEEGLASLSRFPGPELSCL